MKMKTKRKLKLKPLHPQVAADSTAEAALFKASTEMSRAISGARVQCILQRPTVATTPIFARRHFDLQFTSEWVIAIHTNVLLAHQTSMNW